MLHDRVELPVDVLVTVLRWHGIDQPHTVLSTTVRWLDDDGRRDVDRKARAELTTRGLATDRGVDAEFQETMGVLARPEIEVYGWLSSTTGTVGVLAAYASGEAVLLVRAEEAVRLQPIRSDSLAEAVIAQLPAVPPAHGRSLNAPELELTGGGQHRAIEDEGFAGFGSQATPSADVKLLRALVAEPRTGTGELYVAVRDDLGRRRKTQHAVSYLDVAAGRAAAGRWMTQLSVNRSGGRWVYAAPATVPALVSKLYEMYRGLS